MRRVNANDSTSIKKGRKFNKTADQLPRCQVFVFLERAASALSSAVSHNGAMKALFVRRLKKLIR